MMNVKKGGKPGNIGSGGSKPIPVPGSAPDIKGKDSPDTM